MEFSSSQIALLVLGFIKNERCYNSYQAFLEGCRHFDDIRERLKSGTFSTRVAGMTLLDYFNEYSAIYHTIQVRLEETDYFVEKRPKSSLVDQLSYLLEHNHGGVKNSTPYSEVETTPVESLPGNAQSDQVGANSLHKTTPKRKQNKTRNSKEPSKEHSSEMFESMDDAEKETGKVLAQTLLDCTEVHVKLSDTITSIWNNTPEVIGDRATNTEVSEGASKELEALIRNVVQKTEEDPVYTKMFDEIIGTAAYNTSNNKKPTTFIPLTHSSHFPEENIRMRRLEDPMEVENNNAVRSIIAASTSFELNTPSVTNDCPNNNRSGPNNEVYVYDGTLDSFLKSSGNVGPVQNPIFLSAEGLLVVPQAPVDSAATGKQFYLVNNNQPVFNVAPTPSTNKEVLTETDILAMPTVIVRDRENPTLVQAAVMPKSTRKAPARSKKTANKAPAKRPNTRQTQAALDRENKAKIEAKVVEKPKVKMAPPQVEVNETPPPMVIDEGKSDTPKHVRNLNFSTPLKCQIPDKPIKRKAWDADLRGLANVAAGTRPPPSKKKPSTTTNRNKKKTEKVPDDKIGDKAHKPEIDVQKSVTKPIQETVTKPIQETVPKTIQDTVTKTIQETVTGPLMTQGAVTESKVSQETIEPLVTKASVIEATVLPATVPEPQTKATVTQETVTEPVTKPPVIQEPVVESQPEPPAVVPNQEEKVKDSIKEKEVSKDPPIMELIHSSPDHWHDSSRLSLNTPLKDGIPKTPGIAISTTPFSQLLEEQLRGVDLISMPTPKIPITPGFSLTPMQSGPYNRPTDYSTSSSYYQPSDTEQNKSIEQLIEESKKHLSPAKIKVISDVLVRPANEKNSTNEHVKKFNHSLIGKKNLNLLEENSSSSSSDDDDDDSSEESSSDSDETTNDTMVRNDKIVEVVELESDKIVKVPEEKSVPKPKVDEKHAISEIIGSVKIRETLKKAPKDMDMCEVEKMKKNLEETRKRTIQRLRTNTPRKKAVVKPKPPPKAPKAPRARKPLVTNKRKVEEKPQEIISDKGEDEDEAEKLVKGLRQRGIHLVPNKSPVKSVKKSTEIIEEVKKDDRPIKDMILEVDDFGPPLTPSSVDFDRASFTEHVHVRHDPKATPKPLVEYNLEVLEKGWSASVYVEHLDSEVNRTLRCTPLDILIDYSPKVNVLTPRRCKRLTTTEGGNNNAIVTKSAEKVVEEIKIKDDSSSDIIEPEIDDMMNYMIVGSVREESPNARLIPKSNNNVKKRKTRGSESEDKQVEKKTKNNSDGIKILKKINVEDFLNKLHGES